MTLHAEYAAVNGSSEDKYNRPKQFKVTWYDGEDNELHEYETASRMLAENMAFAKGGTFRTI